MEGPTRNYVILTNVILPSRELWVEPKENLHVVLRHYQSSETKETLPRSDLRNAKRLLVMIQ